MYRHLLIALMCLTLSGCTVGWYELREVTNTGTDAQWKCPQTIEIDVKSGHATRTLGFKEARTERVSALKAMAREVANSVLQGHGCSMSMVQQSTSDDVLTIKIDERQQLSALPQEYLTGLSFGLIPSWGTRPEEFIIEFSQNERSATFAIDEVRINHITMTPFTVLAFALENERPKFKKALELFIAYCAQSEDNDLVLRFGYMKEYPSGAGLVTYETNIIPFKLGSTGFRFGFTVESRSGTKFSGHEIIYFPNIPKKFSGDLIDKNNDKTKVIKATTQGKDAYWSETFWFDDGDPIGDYKLDIFINDRFFKTVNFEVVKPK